jgi:two-component system, cell cycle sensor histidine kinase and response regulator CckA
LLGIVVTQETSQPFKPAERGAPKGTPVVDDPAVPEDGQAPAIASPAESARDHEINKELRRLNRALRALSACNKALARAGSEPELLREICDVVVRLGGYRLVWIGYQQMDERKTVRPMACAGHEVGYLRDIEVNWTAEVPNGRGPSGTAIRENRTCVVLDTARDPAFAPWRERALERGYAAVLALPLREGDRAFGVLMIYSDQVGSFENSELELLAEMASNLSLGICAIRSQEEGRKATAALREAESKYRQLVEDVPAISYVAEAGVMGRFFYLSPQVTKILGYAAEDCVNDPWFWWNHLNPKDHGVAQLEDSWEEHRPVLMEYRMRRQDGREVWIRDEALIYRDETGKRLIRGLMIDITEQKLAQEALRDSEERYRTFVERSSEGIFRMEYNPPVPCDLPVKEQIRLAHERGCMAECNDAMAKMYGRNSAKELMGRRLSEFLVLHDPLTQQFMERFVEAGYRITDQESRELDAHGRKKIFRNTMIGMVVDGCWVRTWGITRDVTERMHLEDQLRNAQQLEAIGRLAGGVAHDFNNILSIIMGHGELLLATGGADEEARSGLLQIRRASLRAASLTQQLLAFSRKQVLQPRVLDLNEAVTEVQKMLSRVIGEDIELAGRLDPSLKAVKVDPGQVEQVLMNLAVNARDAMPQGGKLTMDTSNVEIGAEHERGIDLPRGSYVLLKVSDTGEGIAPANLPHIFEPFFTTKPMSKGTGLGLATVYGIVKQSGGSIQVESEPGKGSVFSIYLPAAEGVAPQESERHGEDQATGGTETILIAEDEPDLRALTRIFLEGYGYKVLAASNAQEALALADKYAEGIDLLLTDVIMPGMSGSQLADKILQKRPKTRIVYMTGYTEDMVVQHRVLEPGVQLLQKPFKKAELALKVRNTLDGRN